MPFQLEASSSDIWIEASGRDPGQALVEVARAFTQVSAPDSVVEPREIHMVEVGPKADLPSLAVAFVNELVFLFSTQQFLPSEGDLEVTHDPAGHKLNGTLRGERFDPNRHRAGTEVKAATLHEATFQEAAEQTQVRLLLDL